MKYIFFVLVYTFNLYAISGIHILDTYMFEDKKIHELSGLAYDKKVLYGVSDYGVLHHFNLKISNNIIQSITPIKSYELRNKKNEILKNKHRDSEGLIYKKKKLYISFERKHRVEEFSLTGQKIKKISLNKKLKNGNFRSKNKGFEALAYHKKHGFLTAPELPFKSQNTHTIYAKNKVYSFKKSGSITALEFIKTNKLLVLERDFNALLRRQLITLSVVDLKQCKKNFCKVKTLKVLDSYKDKNVDNFEGLTKIEDKLFLMVSDDNGSLFQKTLFVLFEVY